MRICLAALFLAGIVSTASAAEKPIPLALACASVAVNHARLFPAGEAQPETIAHDNECLAAIQGYIKTHCPKSALTIWEQVNRVVENGGPYHSDARALASVCT